MSLAQLASAHYTNKIRGKRLKQFILPQVPGTSAGCEGVLATAGAGVTYGDWIDVALKTLVTADTLVVGIIVDTPSLAEIYTIDLGSTCVTVAGAVTNYDDATDLIAVDAAIEPAHRCEIRLEVCTIAGVILPVMLEFPVLYHSTDGILARIATVSGAETAKISVICVQGFE